MTFAIGRRQKQYGTCTLFPLSSSYSIYTYIQRKYVIFTHLQRRRTQNESPVLLCIAADLSRTTYERICQMFFERFNVPGFAILERPIAQIFASNSITGVVVDIDE